MLSALLTSLALFGLVVGLSLFVYHDSDRLGMDRPGRWAGVVFATTAFGASVIVLTDLPPAAVVVVAIVGPVVYIFEREDAIHGDGSTDEFALPHDGNGEIDSGDETAEEG